MTGRERGWIPTTPEDIEACWAEARHEARQEQNDRLRRAARRRQADADQLRHEFAEHIVDLVAALETRADRIGQLWLRIKIQLLRIAEKLGF